MPRALGGAQEGGRVGQQLGERAAAGKGPPPKHPHVRAPACRAQLILCQRVQALSLDLTVVVLPRKSARGRRRGEVQRSPARARPLLLLAHTRGTCTPPRHPPPLCFSACTP